METQFAICVDICFAMIQLLLVSQKRYYFKKHWQRFKEGHNTSLLWSKTTKLPE